MHESATGSDPDGRPGNGGAAPGQLSRRYSWCIVGGAILPFVATCASIVTILEPRSWFSPAEWRGLAPVSVLISTTLLLAAAPLSGVVAAARGRRETPGAWVATGRICLALGLGAAAWTAGAAVSSVALSTLAVDGGTAGTLLSAHLVQGAVALALGLLGALAATWVADPLDAAALSLTVTGVGSLGLLGAGTLVERLPGAVAEWALAASPVLAVSSAAQIDVMRTDIVYQISPLAHVQLPVPDWTAAAAGYLVAAAVCALALAAAHARPVSRPSSPQH